jgi:hypothetical protein
MANLRALREKIKNITDYSPDLQQYNDQVDDMINDAYHFLWTTKRWTWAFKEYFFKFEPDITPERNIDIATGLAIAAQVNKGSRQVQFSNTLFRLTTIWEGQPIEIQNYEYIISKVVSPTEILLTEQFHGTTAGADTTWKIKFRYYDLPQDCIELLNLSHRDIPNSNGGTGRFPPYGKLIGLMPRRDEQLNLRMDYAASYAEAYVWSENKFIPPAETLSLSQVDNGLVFGFPFNTYLEVCWAFVKDNKIGALSEPQTILFTEGQTVTKSLVIEFKSWDDQTIVADSWQSYDRIPTQYEGYRKQIFWNANFNRTTGERLGLPIWKAFNTAAAIRNQPGGTYLEPMIAADTAGTIQVDYLASIDSGNPVYIEYDGQHQRIRPYPRVDAWDELVTEQPSGPNYSQVDKQLLREGVARYYYKPRLLGFDSDTPQMPNEFHQLIVYKVLETLYDKTGNISNAQSYRARFDKEVKQLEKRYVDHVDSLVQRGQFQLGQYNRFYYDYASLKTNG